MNKTDLTIEGIFKSLDAWREERGLQRTVGNIAANIGEEIVEYLCAENDEQRIDALCDIFVFSVNARYAMGEIDQHDFMELLSDNPPLYKINFIFHLCTHFPYLLSSYDHKHTVFMIATYAKYQIEYLGYDFLIAMDETLKEIHSRTGAMNEATGKWEKFKTEEAMALWYKADYSKAKVA